MVRRIALGTLAVLGVLALAAAVEPAAATPQQVVPAVAETGTVPAFGPVIPAGPPEFDDLCAPSAIAAGKL
jgi:hypothetical protein